MHYLCITLDNLTCTHKKYWFCSELFTKYRMDNYFFTNFVLFNLPFLLNILCMAVCLSVCLSVCLYCMYVCMYVCIYVCTHVRMYVRTHVSLDIYMKRHRLYLKTWQNIQSSWSHRSCSKSTNNLEKDYSWFLSFYFDSGPTSESDYEMHLLPGEKVHMALNGSKQLEWLTLCFWKKSKQSGVNINYRVHTEKNDRLEILEKKNSLRFVLMSYKRYERTFSSALLQDYQTK